MIHWGVSRRWIDSDRMRTEERQSMDQTKQAPLVEAFYRHREKVDNDNPGNYIDSLPH